MPANKGAKAVAASKRVTRRSSQESNASQESNEELELPQSQESISSNGDDEELQQLVKQQYATLAAKKRKDAEKSFLKSSLAKASKDVNKAALHLKSVSEALEKLYEENLLALAENEDTINNLWYNIHETQKKLIERCQKMNTDRMKSSEIMETECIAGRAQINTAFREGQETIDQLKELQL